MPKPPRYFEYIKFSCGHMETLQKHQCTTIVENIIRNMLKGEQNKALNPRNCFFLWPIFVHHQTLFAHAYVRWTF